MKKIQVGLNQVADTKIFLTINQHSLFVEKELSELAGIRTHDLPLEATYYYSEIGISIEAFA